jgi:hypothetical protein
MQFRDRVGESVPCLAQKRLKDFRYFIWMRMLQISVIVTLWYTPQQHLNFPTWGDSLLIISTKWTIPFNVSWVSIRVFFIGSPDDPGWSHILLKPPCYNSWDPVWWQLHFGCPIWSGPGLLLYAIQKMIEKQITIARVTITRCFSVPQWIIEQFIPHLHHRHHHHHHH